MAATFKFEIVSYPVTDWFRAKKFYGETLGMPIALFISDEIGWMEYGDKDGVHLAINLVPGPITHSNGGGIAIFAVEDAHKAVEDLRAMGVRCEDVIVVPDMVTYANFYDPDGNRLQVAGPPPKT